MFFWSTKNLLPISSQITEKPSTKDPMLCSVYPPLICFIQTTYCRTVEITVTLVLHNERTMNETSNEKILLRNLLTHTRTHTVCNKVPWLDHYQMSRNRLAIFLARSWIQTHIKDMRFLLTTWISKNMRSTSKFS